MTDLVTQPTGAPLRKIMVAFVAALALKAINTTIPALFPAVLSSPVWAPLYLEFLTWAPFIAAWAGYQAKEWPSSTPQGQA
jgi:hypothetical protein